MKTVATPLLAAFAAAVVALTMSIPLPATAQSSSCNPKVQTCL